jgi:hypothetical protein
MTRWIVALICLLASFGVAAQLSVRTIPADAKRGTVGAIDVGAVSIDGKTLRLSPGARILSAGNLTVTPNQVATGTLVRYELDGQGQVRTIWILTPDEAKRR